MKCLLLISFLLCDSLIAQVKSFKLYDNQYVSANHFEIYVYAHQNDSIKKMSYYFSSDSLVRSSNTKILKSIDERPYFPVVNISQLDNNFDLFAELHDKVYYVDRPDTKDFYYLKNDTTWVHRSLQKRIVWQLEKEEFVPFYKIDLGNKHFVYWVESSGLIFKKSGKIETNFEQLRYFYQDSNTHFSVINKNAVDMSWGYFSYGDYKLQLINYGQLFPIDSSYDKWNKSKTIFTRQTETYHSDDNWKYTVSKKGKVVLDSLNLKYYNEKELVAINDHLIAYYNPKMKLDSQFIFRAMVPDWSEIVFLVDNKIKKLSLNGFSRANPDNRRLFCGTVTHYKMQIQEQCIAKFVVGYEADEKLNLKTYALQSTVEIDSLIFLNGTKQLEWSDNGGFDNQIILYKEGKCGLYTFDVKDSVITFNETVPQEFDKIYLANNIIILAKNNHEDILDYYLLNKKMRFKTITCLNPNFLRYKKNENIEGWMSPNGSLFDVSSNYD